MAFSRLHSVPCTPILMHSLQDYKHPLPRLMRHRLEQMGLTGLRF